MSAETDQSSKDQNGEQHMLPQQLQCLAEMRTWVQADANPYGRTDDEFLMTFLRGCEFDLELTKTTLHTYYNCRRTTPQWWTNRDLRDPKLMSLAQLKVTTVLMDKHHDQPTLVITRCNRIGPNLNNFDDHGKLSSIVSDCMIRRKNCQLNGAIWIVETGQTPFWFKIRALQPSTVRAAINSFYKGSPVNIKKIYMEYSMAAYGFIKLILLFLPQGFAQRIHFYHSLSSLSEHIPVEILPEEYGGEAGPMAEHEDAFLKELVASNDYLLNDKDHSTNA